VGPTGAAGSVGSAGPPGSNASGIDNYNGYFAASVPGNVSTTIKAMGLAAAITPNGSGKLFVLFSGMVQNSTAAGNGATINVIYGTGTAPVNGATTWTGGQLSIGLNFIASTTAGKQGFCLHGIVSLTVGTPYWFDISLSALTAGGATVFDVHYTIFELG
jgi:hypothetical protein